MTRHKGFDGPRMFERSKRLLAQLGNPQNAHKTIHVAGTSGKGTVCYMIDAILRAHNQKTGLLVSPHVYDIRERVQINNQYAPEKSYIKAAHTVITHAREMAQYGDAPSYYEVMAAIGFVLTAQQPLKYVVVETGLGGRYDLSNTIKNSGKYCVLTQIGLDHTQILGTTYEQIAREKAEILYHNSEVTALWQKNSVNDVFIHKAEQCHAHISWVKPYGNYEVDDLLLALDATRNIAQSDGWNFDEEVAREAASRVYIPGRFEKRSLADHTVVLDGAHNPQKLAALADRLNRDSLAPCTFVFAIGENQDIKKSLLALQTACKRLIVCEFFLEHPHIRRRALKAATVQLMAHELGFTDVEVVESPKVALQRALVYPESITVTGSFYLLGEVDHMF